MATKYAQHVSTRETPQSEAVPGKKQVANNAGGFAFKIDKWAQLDRFILLGCSGGSYYCSEKEMTKDNAACVISCADEDPARTVARIVQISDEGRAPKNDPAIFALALLSGHDKAKSLALEAVNKVCRIGTHLFQFVDAAQHFRGRGRSFQRALRNWYLSRTPSDVAHQLVKYQQREGWSHRDILRLAKPKVDEPLSTAFRWAVGKTDMVSVDVLPDSPLAIIMAFENAKRATTAKEIVRLISDHKLPREAVPTQWLNSPEVWEALLDHMKPTALIRNLAKMTNVGLIKPLSKSVSDVCAKLGDAEWLKRARVHPLSVLVAMKTYAQGHGEKGSLTWVPVPQVIDALDGAFYKAFDAVEPTGKRWFLACDVSGSMATATIAGMPLSCRDATGALAMVTAKTEPNYVIGAFTSNGWKNGNGESRWGHLYPCGMSIVDISRLSRLDSVIKRINELPMGGTDCALPMLYATANNLEVDVFYVATDNETWYGSVHPFQALQRYREKTGINAKLVVCAMTATSFSIADPSDARMLDIVGFDTTVTTILSEFAKDSI